MLDFTYGGLLQRSGLTPPRDALNDALTALTTAPAIEVDRAAPAWVHATVAAWARSQGIAVRELVKVVGTPIDGDLPLVLSVPDRAGVVPSVDWKPPARSVVVTHRFRRDGALSEISLDPRADPAVASLRRGTDLAKRLRQVRRVRRLDRTVGAWCAYIQPAEPAALLAAMGAGGIRAGDPLDLAEFAGGIAAIVPEDAADGDLARYIAALAAALD